MPVGALRAGARRSRHAAAAVALIGTGRTAVAVLEHAASHADDVVRRHGGGRRARQPLRPGRPPRRRDRRRRSPAGRQGGRASRRSAPTSPSTTAGRMGRRGAPAAVEPTPTLVLDGVGGDLGRGAFELLGPGGRIVLFGWSSGTVTPFTSADLAEREPQRVVVDRPGDDEALGEPRAARAAALADAAAGVWSPVVTRFPLADAAGAHRALEVRATVGKTVLVPVASGRWTRWPMSPPRSSRWPTASCGAPSPPPVPTGARTRGCCTRSGSGTAPRSPAGSPPRRRPRRRATWPRVRPCR